MQNLFLNLIIHENIKTKINTAIMKRNVDIVLKNKIIGIGYVNN